jgi:hypothetical protein
VNSEDPFLTLVAHLARWQPVSDYGQAHRFVRRLEHAIGSREHPLFGKRVIALYSVHPGKDVLFKLMDDLSFARVHLTDKSETDPRWPTTHIFANLLEWARFEFEDIAYVFQTDAQYQ